MPSCELTPEFLQMLLEDPPLKTVQYSDTSIIGFVLEFRSTGSGTWYFRYRNAQKKNTYHRIGTTKDVDALLARALAHQLNIVFKRDGSLDTTNIPKELAKKNKKKIVKTTLQHEAELSISIKNFIYERYLPYMQASKQSWKLDKQILETYFLIPKNKTLFEKTLHTIKSSEILKWRNGLPQKNIKFSTCNRILWVIKAVFNCAVKWELLKPSQNPCKHLQMFEEKRFSARYLNSEEASRLLDTLKKMSKNKQAQALQLLIFTGARKSEILPARWENVDLKNRFLTVVSSSTETEQGKFVSKKRTIPLSDDALVLLQDLAKSPKAKESPWLFPGRKLENHLQSVFDTWDIVRKRLGLEDVRLHDLRHSYANFLVHSGCSIQGVQQLLGHNTRRMTMRYAELV